MPTRTKYSRLSNSSRVRDRISSNRDLYNNRKWKNYSRKRRSLHRRCQGPCGLLIVNISESVTDHIIPINHGGSFWDSRNHQTMCISCHNSKSATESMSKKYDSIKNSKGELIPRINGLNVSYLAT